MEPPRGDRRIVQWLADASQAGASDVHIVPGHPPMLRLHGELCPLGTEELSQNEARRLLLSLLDDVAHDRFATFKNLDFALQFDVQERPQRYRANYFRSGESIGACFRIIPRDIPDFTWARFPTDIAHRLAHFRNGLVLFSGVSGAGKTTSLAMIINLLNREGGYRIVTIEDPIEYLFERTESSVITQREVGRDVDSFADGLKYGLRQDPDVFLVGEIRDRETAQLALSAAETGHLVFSTLHTRDAKGAISRYTDLFPQSAQADVRSQLALSLRAVVSQHLLPSIEPGAKRELALEIMFCNSAVAAAIRTGRLETLDNAILTGRTDGMITLNESVKRLFSEGRIGEETALQYMSDTGLLRR